MNENVLHLFIYYVFILRHGFSPFFLFLILTPTTFYRQFLSDSVIFRADCWSQNLLDTGNKQLFNFATATFQQVHRAS